MKIKSVLLTLLLAFFTHQAAAEPLPKAIRFGGFGQGFGQPYGQAVLAIAQDKGFIADAFKGTPVKITFEYFTGVGPAINEAIASGQLDFAQYGALPNVIGKANRLPTRIVANYGSQTVFGVARKGSAIRSFKDLKGRRVGISKGTVLHWAFLKTLTDNGLSEADVRVVDLKGADQIAALAAGSIDAAVYTHALLKLRDENIADVFYASKNDPAAATAFGAITVTQQFEQQYPEATQKVVAALVRAAHWLSNDGNREEALRIWAKSGVPYELIKEDFEGSSLRELFNPRVDPYFVNRYRDVIAFTKAQKLIRNDIDLDQWFAPQYVERAIKEQGLDALWPLRQ
ncbi:MAG: ABC transporter substrate-binding protein [Burkholderiaceae bacterium]|jgi:sulfonate transport system substrate-binding protein|nr:ABC transporter substrate-binding protein [Burkholderiaceae bacterium]